MRPVSRRQRSSVARAPRRSSTATCVTARLPPTGAIDDARVVGEGARDDGQVLAAEIVRAKFFGQRAVGVLGLREDEQAARLEIDAVHDVHGRAARAPREQAREVVAVALGRGRREQARRLVDDDDVLVLEDDREGRQARLVARARLAARRGRRALERAADVRDDLLAGVHELPAIFTRRPSTNTPPMSMSSRARRRDRPGTRAASA